MSSPVISAAPGAHTSGELTAPGLVARFSPIKGETPKSVLSHPIWLPAILGTPTLTESAVHNEYETLSAGQFSQPAQGPPNVGELRTFPVDTLTVAWDPPWMVVSGQNSIRLRNSLLGIVRARRPVHLLVTWNPHPGGFPEVDMDVTVRSATREMRPQELDTHYMSLAISEWRDPKTPANSSRPPGGHSSRLWSVDLPATHVLARGDTLDSLSYLYYANYSFWRHIRDANGIPKRFGQKTAIVKLGGHFKAGAKIKIPLIPTSGNAVPFGG